MQILFAERKNEMKKIFSLLLCLILTFNFFVLADAATKISFGEPQVYTIENAGDKINLNFSTTSNDAFYRIMVKNLSVNDNLCMSLTDKYDEEISKYDYWAYLGKGVEKYVDLKLNKNEKFNLSFWANGNNECGNIKISISEIVDDVKDGKSEGKFVALNQGNIHTIDAANDTDAFKFNTTNNNSFYRVVLKNSSINDNICMSITDKYDEELGKYDCWSYLGKGVEKFIDLKLNPNETYFVSVWANGKEQTGNYELTVKELIDDVPDTKELSDAINSNTAYIRSIDANNDVDFYTWTADKAKLSVTLKNNSINDNMCLIIYDIYNAELAKFDYWSYLGKGSEKKIDVDTSIGSTYYIAVWANGKYETGDYKLCIGNENTVVGKKALPSSSISVLINNVPIQFDQPPILENGRTLVPLRAIFEALGADVQWENNTKTVTAIKDGTQISLQIGSTRMYVNGSTKTLDVPAKLINSRTLVPVRAISEAFGCKVDWIQDTRTVVITQ